MNLTQALQMAREIQKAKTEVQLRASHFTDWQREGGCDYDDVYYPLVAAESDLDAVSARHAPDLASFILGPVREVAERASAFFDAIEREDNFWPNEPEGKALRAALTPFIEKGME